MSSHCTNIQTPSLMLLLWLHWHLHKDSTNRVRLSNDFPRDITCLNLIPVSLTCTSRTHQGVSYVRHSGTTLLLATHGGWCVHTCTQFSHFYANIGPQGTGNGKLQHFPASLSLDIVAIVTTSLECHRMSAYLEFFQLLAPVLVRIVNVVFLQDALLYHSIYSLVPDYWS